MFIQYDYFFVEYSYPQVKAVSIIENTSLHSLKRLNIHNFIKDWRKDTYFLYRLVLV